MKAVSLIWILSMLLLGLAPAADISPVSQDAATEQCSEVTCCETGCCCLPAADGGDQELPEKNDGCGDDCQCDATAQFLAIYFPDDEGRTHSTGQATYRIYVNQYHFEYQNLLFQPPRLMQA
jgi:hypothetical protein